MQNGLLGTPEDFMQLQPHLGASSTPVNGVFSKPGSAPFPEDEKWDT